MTWVDPWPLLGIPPTDDRNAVRRAYAEKLKRTNPEDDAEGFKALRLAYEVALREAEDRRAYPEHFVAFEADTIEPEALEPEAAPIERLDLPPATIEPPEPRDLEDSKRAALIEALDANASPWAVRAALDAVLTDPALERLDVQADTESWLSQVLWNHRPASDQLVDPVIAFFGYTPQSDRVGSAWDPGRSAWALRERIEEERRAQAFLARIRDRRHEFHRAYRRLSRPLTDRAPAGRALDLLALRHVERFLAFADDKAPAIHDHLDDETVDWWRDQIAKHTRPLDRLGFWVRVIFGLLGVSLIAFAIFGPREEAPDPIPPPLEIERSEPQRRAELRALCLQSVDLPDKPLGIRVCAQALELMPGSLEIQRAKATLHLLADEPLSAEANFRRILEAAPNDPYARHGHAFAADDAAEAAAFSSDPAVVRRFAALGFETPAAAKLHQPQALPDRPAILAAPGPFDRLDAQLHLGLPAPPVGEVEIVCRFAPPTLSDCRVLAERPAGSGAADMALHMLARSGVALSTDTPPGDVRIRYDFPAPQRAPT